MKNYMLSVSILLLVVSCKKENSNPESKVTSDSAMTETKPEGAATTNTVALAEYTVEKTNELLQNKSKDTIFVTNFFATWCGPCMREIPHFKEKMAELKDQPVKFTFISLDDKSDWNDKVKTFGQEQQLSQNIVLLDGAQLNPDFFTKNFKTWQGESIPFTFIKKGDKTDETVGSMSKEQLDSKLAAFLK